MEKHINTRRLTSLLLTFLLILTCIVSATAASDEQPLTQTTTDTIYYEDGSYDVVTLTVEVSAARSTKTKSGSRTVTKYSNKDVKQFSFTVKGVFAYDGNSAWATNVSTSYEIFESGWSCTKKSASKSGNSVTGSATFKYGLAVNYPSATVTCSPTGVIS